MAMCWGRTEQPIMRIGGGLVGKVMMALETGVNGGRNVIRMKSKQSCLLHL